VLESSFLSSLPVPVDFAILRKTTP